MVANQVTTNGSQQVGRFSVEFEVVNHQDVIAANLGAIPPERIRRARISGVVDNRCYSACAPWIRGWGPRPETGQIPVRFADGRQDQKKVVGDTQVEIQSRSSVFTAVVEPGRADALIGAIVLEELDFIPDCTTRTLVPRDPRGLFAELD